MGQLEIKFVCAGMSAKRKGTSLVRKTTSEKREREPKRDIDKETQDEEKKREREKEKGKVKN